MKSPGTTFGKTMRTKCMLRLSSWGSCPEEMETVQEGTKATRKRKPESLKEKRESHGREREKGKPRNPGGELRSLWHFKLCWLDFLTRLNLAAKNESTFFFSFFQNSIKFISTGCLSYSALLQADENPSSANDRPLPFPHSNLRSEHKQLQLSWQKPGTPQASLPPEIKTCHLFLQPRVSRQGSLATVPRGEPFLPSGRYVNDPEGGHTLALISPVPAG